MKRIVDQVFPNERALYNESNAEIINCRFEGEEDGESALKECSQISMSNCFMDLRYPLWHVNGVIMRECEQTVNCRAALWYSNDINVVDSKLNGIKALRECKNISIVNSTVSSAEFGWRCNGIKVEKSTVSGEYAFFESKNLTLDGVEFSGKYSFQYCKNLTIKNSALKTKDAFWHAENVTVENSVVQGEYLGWYSKNLTLINCKIIGTQPLCYCKKLTLINCETEGCDLSFEYSEVNAEIKGEIVSVKNVIKGKVIADKIGSIIKEDSKLPLKAKIIQISNKQLYKSINSI